MDIWTQDFDPQIKIDTDILIGHSTGANYCLCNWKINKNARLILVGLLIPKRSMFGWIWQWLRFIIFEGHQTIKGAISLKYLFSTLKKVNKLSKFDPLEIIGEVPKENIVFIRGKNDKFFFDKKVAENLILEGFRIIEVEGVGHHWDAKFDDIIDQITSESN